MNFTEYTEAAMRTLAFSHAPHSWQAQVPGQTYHLLHACIGLSTEIGEIIECCRANKIDLVNLKEELGDLWWYAALLNHVIGPNVVVGVITPEHPNVPLVLLVDEMLVDHVLEPLGDCFDVLKRRIYYGSDDSDPKASQHRFSQASAAVICGLDMLTLACGFSEQEVWESNIAKLSKRYPEKFTTVRAINRDLDAEREVLE